MLFVPLGFGKRVWRFLQYHEVKAYGLQNQRRLFNEQNAFYFPDDFPNSLIHKQRQEEKINACIRTYFRKPPDKRVNYIKIRSPYAFGHRWRDLWADYVASEAKQTMSVEAEAFDFMREFVPFQIKMHGKGKPNEHSVLYFLDLKMGDLTGMSHQKVGNTFVCQEPLMT